MILQTLRVGPLAVNCYVVGDEKTREVIVIDPGGNVREIVDSIRQTRGRVGAIVLTHAHFDHVMGVAGVKNETGAPLCVSAAEEKIMATTERQGQAFGIAVPPLPPVDRWLEEGDIVQAGALELQVILTPGHTPGGICLWGESENILFSGDTLLHGSIGRADFPGGSMEALLHSIRKKLLVLPNETIVYPGHGVVTTIGEEKMLNPFLKNYV